MKVFLVGYFGPALKHRCFNKSSREIEDDELLVDDAEVARVGEKVVETLVWFDSERVGVPDARLGNKHFQKAP